MQTNTLKSKKSLLIILLLLLLIVALSAVCIWALFFRNEGENKILAPDYAPREEDSNAVDMENKDEEKLETKPGGGAVGLEYSDKITVDLSDKMIYLHYGNPSRSHNNAILQIVVQDTLLAQSNLLIPGKRLPKLPLTEEALSLLEDAIGDKEEVYFDGMFIASFYDPETGEKAMLNSTVEITVTVKK